MLCPMKRLWQEIGVFGLFCALTAVMTWPLAANFTTALAHPEDPAITTWILDWSFHALVHQPLALFDANIFHPHRLTFAFSENLLGIAVPLLPLHLAGMAPITIHNVALFLAFALSGYGAYVLARVVTGSTGAAIASGIFFAFFSFRFTHLPHLQHLWALWLPLMLAALIHFAAKPTWRRAALLGAAFLMNGLTNLHWFAFGSVAIGLSVLLLARRERRYWMGAAAAIGIACVALLPMLLPYQRVAELYGTRVNAAETISYSANARDWLVAPLQSRWYAHSLGDAGVNPERWLFPGVLVLLFALAGLVRTQKDRARGIAVLWIALGFLGSLGLNTPFGRMLFEIPPFSGIRTPARWSFIAYTGLALLAACGIASLTRSLRPRSRHAVHAVIAILFVVELFPAPLRWYLAVPENPPVYDWLASGRTEGPIVELPLAQRDQYEVMLRSTGHHRRTVNGVSSFVAPALAGLTRLSEEVPIGDSFLAQLERLGVTTIVIHADRLGGAAESTRAWVGTTIADRRLAYVGRFDAGVEGDYVFATRRHARFTRFVDTPPDLRVSLDRFLAAQPAQSDGTFGMLALPRHDDVVRGRLTVAGFALSPWGIREVNLRFANGRVVIPADLVEGPEIRERYPWYPMTTKAGFRKDIDPLDLPPGTDLQVEIVDGRGRRKRLRDIWFTWTR
jgi:hypothetical protein